MESYSYRTKIEICKQETVNECCAVAECYGMLLYGNLFNVREIKIVTGNKALGRRIIDLFYLAFGIAFDIMPAEDEHGKQVYSITDAVKIVKIYELFGFTREKTLAHNINLGVLENKCCQVSFMRGAFLTGGAVTDPMKSYHLELVTAHYSVSKQTVSLLLEIRFSPKEISRNGNYIIYFKQSTAIEDFLTLIGAPVHAMKLMATKIEKDMRNAVNRKVNCDTANVTKLVEAASAQIDAINKIKKAGIYDTLSDKIRKAADLRLEHPEAGIKELGELSDPPVSKSCMNHRMRKLVEISLTYQGL